jgi:mono/diheme cytochrome c family protein
VTRSTADGQLQRWVGSLLLTCALGIGACAPDPGQVREWKATDHDHEDRKRSGPRQVAQTKQVDDVPELAELAWGKNCVRCHGQLGQGDGPQGAANHAPDLTRDDFLSSKSDAELRATIRSGRNQMPAFGESQLPERVLDAVVLRIRGKGHL